MYPQLETPSGIERVKVFFSDKIVKPLNQNGCSRIKHDPRFQELEFANDFKEENFQVDILLGADAAYRFLGAVDGRIKEPCIQQSKFGVIVSGPLSESTTRLVSQQTPSIQTHIAKFHDHFDVNSIKSESTLSIENLVDNSELSIQFERILQNQSLNYDRDKNDTNEFIQDYQQKVEFRDGQYFAPLP